MSEQLDLEDWLRENPESLTEQWKKGELKLGECYFIRLKSGKIIPQMYSFVCIDGKHHCTDFGLSYGNVEEVLAPVPTYEEWQELKEDYVDKHDKYLRLSTTNHQLRKIIEDFNTLDVAKENQQLKELLRECKESVLFEAKVAKETSGKDSTAYKILTRILTKIDNAIGEK